MGSSRPVSELSAEEYARLREYRRFHDRKRVLVGTDRKRNAALRKKCLDKLGNICVWCGFSDPRALHIDHVNDDGNEERKRLKTPYQRHKAVMDDTEGRYQILCANCNFIKKYETHKRKMEEKYGTDGSTTPTADSQAGAGAQ